MAVPARVLEGAKAARRFEVLAGGRGMHEVPSRRPARRKAAKDLALPLLLVFGAYLLSQALGAGVAGSSREVALLRQRLALAEVRNHSLVEAVAKESSPETLLSRAVALGMVPASSRTVLPPPPSPLASDLPTGGAGTGVLAEGGGRVAVGDEREGEAVQLRPAVWGAFVESR